MLPTVLLAAVLSANPEPVKLAATSFQFVNISPQLAAFCSEHFAQLLTLEGIRVTTASEISAMIGLERQKALMGCADSSTSCIAELANALGVDGLVTGTVGKFGKAYQVNVKILSAQDGRPLSAYSGRVRDEEAILDEYTKAAKKMVPELLEKIGRLRKIEAKGSGKAGSSASSGSVAPKTVARLEPSAPPIDEAPVAADIVQTPSEPSGGVRRYAWIPAAAGVVFAGVGVGLLVDSGGKARALAGVEGPSTLTPAEALQTASAGRTAQTLGVVSLIVGGAAVAAGGAMFLFGAPVRADVAAGPGRVGLVFSGALP